jgi:hypothetical protein
VDIEQSPSSVRTLPILEFDPTPCNNPDIAAARLEEAVRLFGDPTPQKRPVGAKSWTVDPSLFDAAVDFAMGDEAFPEVDFGPTRFHFYHWFHWREPQAGFRPPSERDPRRSSSYLGIHIGGRRIFVQPTFVFTEPWTSNALRTFLDGLEPELPFRIRNQYFKRVLAPKGKSRRGRVLNLPADWRQTDPV